MDHASQHQHQYRQHQHRGRVVAPSKLNAVRFAYECKRLAVAVLRGCVVLRCCAVAWCCGAARLRGAAVLRGCAVLRCCAVARCCGAGAARCWCCGAAFLPGIFNQSSGAQVETYAPHRPIDGHVPSRETGGIFWRKDSRIGSFAKVRRFRGGMDSAMRQAIRRETARFC
jgi:hypothetical protein